MAPFDRPLSPPLADGPPTIAPLPGDGVRDGVEDGLLVEDGG